MRQRMLAAAAIVLTAPVAPSLRAEEGLSVSVDDRTGAVSASYAGAALIRMEALQLVDTSGGWKVLYAYGTSGRVRVTRRATDEGEEVAVQEEVADVISCRKRIVIEPDSLSVTVDYNVAPNVSANRNYYFLDIPLASVEGALCTVTADGKARRGILDPAQGGGPVASGISACAILTPKAELSFALEARNAEWTFADWTDTEHKSYRLRVERPVEKEGFAVHLAFTMKAKPSDPNRLAAAIEDWRAERERQRKERLTELRMIEKKPLAIHSVRPSAKAVPVYEKFELTIDATGTWDDPFDPEQIDVQGRFASPSGKEAVVPGFLYREYRLTDDGEKPVGAPVWKVRFAATEEGRWGYFVTARDRSGEVKSEAGSFEATAGRSDGFVRVAKKSPLYLQFDSGAPYFPIGTNCFTSTRLGRPAPPDRLGTVERYVNGLAHNGADFIRLRMDSWWLSIEGSPDDAVGYLGAGKFDLPTAWIVDEVFDLAHERNCFIQLCLYNANANVNDPKEDWRRPYNVFLKENGGPLDSIGQFWTDPGAARLVERKLRYAVARWGYSTNLMAWEFFNEVVMRKERPEAIVAWHDRMSTYLRSVDPWRHLITTSPMGGSFGVSDGLWALPNMDIVQVHSYEFTDMGAGMPGFCRDAVSRYGKPFIVGEFGLPRRMLEQGGLKVDRDGLHLHNGIWASALAGSAGTAMHWYITSYIDPLKLYPQFKGLSAFMRQVPILSGDLVPIKTGALRYVKPPSKETFRDAALLGRPRFQRAEVSRFTVAADGTINDAKQLNGFLWGLQAHKDLRNPPTFVVNFREPGQFVVHIGTVVGNGDNPIRAYLDGRLALDENLPAGEGLGESSKPIPQYDNWHTLYNKDLVIEVPTGQHEVRVESLGKDRAEVSYKLIGYVSNRNVVDLRVVGLGNAEGAYLWIQNMRNTWQARWDGVALKPVVPTVLEVSGLRDGSYRAEFWDTAEGKVTSTAKAESKAGRLVLAIPEVRTDVACSIRR